MEYPKLVHYSAFKDLDFKNILEDEEVNLESNQYIHLILPLLTGEKQLVKCRSLHLGRNRLSEKDTRYIKLLLRKPNLRMLDLIGNNIRNMGICQLEEDLVTSKVEDIRLGSNGLDKAAMECLARVLERRENGIGSIYLYKNKLRGSGKFLGKMISHIHGALGLSQTMIDNQDVLDLSEGMCKSQIKELYLRENNITASGIETFLQRAFLAPCLRHLYLSRNHLGNQGAYYIGEYLKGNPPLELLAINWIEITVKGLSYIADALFSNSHLRELYMYGNKLINGAYCLVPPLCSKHSLCKLKCLNLSFCSLGRRDFMHIANIIKYNTTLSTLEISDNQLTPLKDKRGCKAFENALHHNTHLIHLKISPFSFTTYMSVYLTENRDLHSDRMNPVHKANVLRMRFGTARYIPTLFNLCDYYLRYRIDEKKRDEMIASYGDISTVWNIENNNKNVRDASCVCFDTSTV